MILISNFDFRNIVNTGPSSKFLNQQASITNLLFIVVNYNSSVLLVHKKSIRHRVPFLYLSRASVKPQSKSFKNTVRREANQADHCCT